ncbi:unnamed protein product [Durusdinium trenchii]|uniref:Pseudouridine synthase RsuA/RluA-like domain-containing protein n=1 Tax=Durusdinium trenchii TaxID=1381693 RepID=A0ABP0K672_9DINO
MSLEHIRGVGVVLAADATSRQWQHGLFLVAGLAQKAVQANAIIYNSCESACNTLDGWQRGLSLMHKLSCENLQADIISFSAGMSCGRLGNWQHALCLLESAWICSIQGNAVSYGIATSCLSVWQQSLFHEMRLRQIEANMVIYNTSLSVAEQQRGWRWQLALQQLSHLENAKLQSNSRTCQALASSTGKASEWTRAVQVLSLNRQRTCNVELLTTVLSACEQGNQWEIALCLLCQSEQQRVQVDVVTYNTAISACAKCGRWELAFILWERLARLGLKEDGVTFNAVMKSLGQSGQWRRALSLLGSGEMDGRKVDVITFASAMVAFEGSQWDQVLGLFADALDKKLQANEVLYNTAINTCGAGLQWLVALDLVHSMSSSLILPSVVSWDSVMLACLGNEDLAMELLLEHSFLASAALEHISEFGLEDLSMALVGLSGDLSACSTRFQLAAQNAAEQWIQRSDSIDRTPRMPVLDSDFQGQELLSILFSCTMAGCPSSRLRRSASASLRHQGRRLDTARRETYTPFLAASSETAARLEDRCVWMKPAGWEVFGGHGGLRQLKDYVISLEASKETIPILRDEKHNFGFLHRLDVPSSGLILEARTYEAFYDLQVQLHSGEISREYSVLCHGWLPTSVQHVDASTCSLRDQPTRSGGRGKLSRTALSVSGYLGGVTSFSLLLVKILTGRKHQIRSHLAHIGHPTLRDKMYSSQWVFISDGSWCSRNWLHRHRIVFVDRSRRTCEASCQLPKDLEDSLSHLEGVERGRLTSPPGRLGRLSPFVAAPKGRKLSRSWSEVDVAGSAKTMLAFGWDPCWKATRV